MTGSLLLAPLATTALGGVGLAEGRTVIDQLGAQALGVGVTAIWSAIATVIIAKAAALIVPMRVDAEAEHDGLDLSSHGERAYEFD
jgi:Amt family ammonium transporter